MIERRVNPALNDSNVEEGGVPTRGLLRMRNNHLQQVLLIILLLSAMTLVLYWPVQSFDFVYDDDLYVATNRTVRGGFTLDGLTGSVTTFHAGNWHPLTMISHMVDSEAYGLNAGGHHRTNVLIHCASAVLLFLVLAAMTDAFWSSALVAALFAIHPLHVESVAWVAERKDVLSGFFWILSMGAYAHYAQRPTIPRYLLAMGLFILGILSKPMVVTLPFVLLLLDYWPLQRFADAKTVFDKRVLPGSILDRSAALRLVVEKIPFLILVVPSCIVAVIAQESAGALLALETIPLQDRIANALVSYAEYIGKMVWPVDLAVLYPYAGVPPVWKIGGAFLFLAAISYIAVRKAREMPWLFVGWLWYLGTLVPVIGIVQVGSQSMADRYTYLPSVGLFIATAWGAKAIVETFPALKRPVMALFFIALAGLLLLARPQVLTWKNSVTLFEHAIAVTTVNPVAHNNIGVAYLDGNDCERAVPHFLKAIEQRNDYASAFHNLGVCAIRGSHAEYALHCFRQAILIDPRFTKPRMERGLLFMQQQRLDDAMEDFLQVLRIDPAHDGAHTNLSLILVQQGRLGDAEMHLGEALRLNPGSVEALNALGIVRVRQQRVDDAVTCFLKALERAPGHPIVEKNLRTVSQERKTNTVQ